MKEHQTLGKWGEEVAEKYLRKKGYETLAKNYRWVCIQTIIHISFRQNMTPLTLVTKPVLL